MTDNRENSAQARAVDTMLETADRITDDLRQLLGDRPEAIRAVLLKAVVNVLVQEYVDDRSRGLLERAREVGRELEDVAAQIEEKVA